MTYIPKPFDRVKTGLRLEKANQIIGKEFREEEIIRLLEKIEIKFSGKEKDILIFEIPEFRRLDIEREIDLIEEIARMNGYDNLEGDTNFNISVSCRVTLKIPVTILRREITNHFVGRGFNQIMTSPLIEENQIRSESGKIVKLKNSISSEMNSLRTNLIFGMLKVMESNYNNSGKDISLKLFEIGKTFTDEGDKFNEETRLIIALSGKRDSGLIYGGEKEFDIFDLKGEAEMFLSKLNLENYRLFYNIDNANEKSKIDILANDEVIGNIYYADSSLKKELDIEFEVYFAEINVDRIADKLGNVRYYREISRYPSIKRDLAIVIDNKIGYEKLSDSIKKSAGKGLKSIDLFDIYEDEKIGKDKRSLALTLEFLSAEKTLTDEEINKVVNKIVKNLESNLGATLRA